MTHWKESTNVGSYFDAQSTSSRLGIWLKERQLVLYEYIEANLDSVDGKRLGSDLRQASGTWMTIQVSCQQVGIYKQDWWYYLNSNGEMVTGWQNIMESGITFNTNTPEKTYEWDAIQVELLER